jgi:hypothetical protein
MILTHYCCHLGGYGLTLFFWLHFELPNSQLPIINLQTPISKSGTLFHGFLINGTSEQPFLCLLHYYPFPILHCHQPKWMGSVWQGSEQSIMVRRIFFTPLAPEKIGFNVWIWHVGGWVGPFILTTLPDRNTMNEFPFPVKRKDTKVYRIEVRLHIVYCSVRDGIWKASKMKRRTLSKNSADTAHSASSCTKSSKMCTIWRFEDK